MGRIGRLALGAAMGAVLRPEDDPRAGNRLDVVHVNEIKGSAAATAHLVQFVSVQGRWRSEIAAEGNEALLIGGERLCFSEHKAAAEIPWVSSSHPARSSGAVPRQIGLGRGDPVMAIDRRCRRDAPDRDQRFCRPAQRGRAIALVEIGRMCAASTGLAYHAACYVAAPVILRALSPVWPAAPVPRAGYWHWAHHSLCSHRAARSRRRTRHRA
jgi:hypothetical protein